VAPLTQPIICIAQGCGEVLGEVTADSAYGTFPAYGYLCGQHSANRGAGHPVAVYPTPAIPGPATPVVPFPPAATITP
jgi:hypothetical protein